MIHSRGWLAAVAGLVLATTAVAQQAEMSHEPHQATNSEATDPHAAHRAMMNKARYTASTAEYDVPDVQLIDADGAAVAIRSLLDSDEPIALDFIFTTCTTICPVMTATFAQMQRELGDDAGRVRLISISIDPEYDRPDVLKAYAEQFRAGGNWTFLTGDSNDIESVLRSFDAFAGSKMNHKPIYLLKRPGESAWTRIDGLASGQGLAHEVETRLLN